MKVKLLAQNDLSVTIWNAICETYPSDSIIEELRIGTDGDYTEADVELTVNGKSVDLEGTLKSYFDMLDEMVSKRASEVASQMVADLALESIREKFNAMASAIEGSAWAIKDEMHKWMTKRGMKSFVFSSDDD